MCKAVEEYSRKNALKTRVDDVKNLMQNLKLTLDQALQALGISVEDQEIIRAMMK